jgi:hypothetical protein
MSFYEQNISERLLRLGWTADGLSATTRHLNRLVSKATISGAFNGTKEFDNDTKLYLLSLLTKVENIAKAAYPLKLNMRDSRTLAQLVHEADNTPGDLPSLSDLFLLNSVLTGHGLKELADDRRISLAEVRLQLATIAVKVERASWQLTEAIKED